MHIFYNEGNDIITFSLTLNIIVYMVSYSTIFSS